MPPSPSRRRSLPDVFSHRSAPYPRVGAAQRKQRRASDTLRKGRQVLAEIDWWRVMAGQLDYESTSPDDISLSFPPHDSLFVLASPNFLSDGQWAFGSNSITFPAFNNSISVCPRLSPDQVLCPTLASPPPTSSSTTTASSRPSRRL